MKWTTTTALILTVGAGGLWVNHLLTPVIEGPDALLARLARDERTGALDEREALRQLTEAIEHPRGLVDPKVTEELYVARARRLRGLGLYSSAREDLERVLATWRRDDPQLEIEASELMAREGRLDDALIRLRRLLRREDVGNSAFGLLGRLESQNGRAKLARAESIALRSVSFKGGPRAREILSELSMRSETDPRSSELVAELRKLFRADEDTPVVEVLDIVNEARDANARARQAFAQAMQDTPTSAAVTTIAGNITAVGQRDNGIDLLLAARALPALAKSSDILDVTLPLLDATGQAPRARELITGWDWKWGGDNDFYRTAATALYFAGEFSGVNRAASAMIESGGDMVSYWSTFFYKAADIGSIAQTARDNPSYVPDASVLRDSIDQLLGFARNNFDSEPFVGARIQAWFNIATAERLLGNEDGEKVALSTALSLATEPRAEYWLRIAELESRGSNVSWERIEARYARALDADPKRTKELVPLWVAAGDRALAASGLDLEELLASTRLSRDGLPYQSVGSSVLWRIGEAHAREGRWHSARVVASKILGEFPHLVPALDTKIEAHLRSTAPMLVVLDVLKRIELVGTDEKTDKFLAQLAVPITGNSLLRAMRAAPDRFGRPTAAVLALEDGDPERAASLLTDLAAVEYSDDLRLLRGQVFAEAGLLEEAAADLERLIHHAHLGNQALDELLRVRLAQGRDGEVATLVGHALQVYGTPDEKLVLVESLLQHGRDRLALASLAALDVARESRTRGFFSALVRATALGGDPNATLVAAKRAEPYVLDGTPELAELLVYVSNRDWTQLPGVIGRLRETDFMPTPFQDAALSLLEERLAHGRRTIERNVAATPRSPEWALLRAAALALEGEPVEVGSWFGAAASEQTIETLLGNRRGRRDPRETLAVLVLLELDNWRAWVIKALERDTEAQAGALWPLWLRVRIEQRLGNDAYVARANHKLHKEFADFGPAWDLDLARMQRRYAIAPLARELLETRVARVEALGERAIEDRVEIALARASRSILLDENQQAVAELGDAMTRERRDDFDAHFTLGALLVRAGQDGLGAQHLREAATSATPTTASASADALLAATMRAASPDYTQRAPIDAVELPTRLAEIVRLFPDDPLVSAAFVRHGGDSTLGPAQRGALARRELARLRRAGGDRPLESMRRGSARVWIGLTLDLAPEVAQEILEVELAARPGDVELWELAAAIEQRFGTRARARVLLRSALAIEPRPTATHAYAALLIQDGAPASEIEALLLDADRGYGGGRTGMSRYLQARVFARSAQPRFDLITAELRQVWNERSAPEGTVQPLDVGLFLTSAFLQWAADLERWEQLASSPAPPAWLPPAIPSREALASEALEILAGLDRYRAATPYTSTLLDAYKGLALQLRENATGDKTAMR